MGVPARRVRGEPLGAIWLAHMNNGFTTTITDGIAELVINRPPVNALDDAGWHALTDEIERLGSDPSARVIVLRPEGRGFCAGVDIKERDAHPARNGPGKAGNYRDRKSVGAAQGREQRVDV